MDRTAVGYFRDRAAADRAYDALKRAGFSSDDISVMGRGMEGGKGLAHEEGATGASGVGVGVVEGLLIGAAAMLIPGIGPIVAVGPLAAGLAGAITGGVTGGIVGGIVGALEDAGVPDDEARFYNERFSRGGYLVTVHTDESHYMQARSLLDAEGAETAGQNVQAVGRSTIPPRAASAEDQRREIGGIR